MSVQYVTHSSGIELYCHLERRLDLYLASKSAPGGQRGKHLASEKHKMSDLISSQARVQPSCNPRVCTFSCIA